MEANHGDLGFAPPHPGEYLKEDILPALGMNAAALAKHLGVSKQALSRVLNERAAVSTEMAIRLGQAFKNGARFWLALQMQHDLWGKERSMTAQVSPLSWNDKAA